MAQLDSHPSSWMAIPGLYLAKGLDTRDWASCPSDVKRRHFVLDGQKLKLFGRRGKTYKGVINLLGVEALRPTTDATAPIGSLELQVRSSRSHATLVCILVPDHSIDDLFMALGNAVPSHATSDDLWRLHMGSRPAPNTGRTHEYRVGKTLGSGTFGKVKLAQRVSDGKLFAIKCLNRTRIVMSVQSGRLAKEIRLLKLLNHPNVIRLHEVLHTQAEIMMVMECAIVPLLATAALQPHLAPNLNPGPQTRLTPARPARWPGAEALGEQNRGLGQVRRALPAAGDPRLGRELHAGGPPDGVDRRVEARPGRGLEARRPDGLVRAHGLGRVEHRGGRPRGRERAR